MQPQRRPLAEARAPQQQSAAGALAEAGAEIASGAEARPDQVADGGRRHPLQQAGDGDFRRRLQEHAVVAHEIGDRAAEVRRAGGGHGQGKGAIDTAAPPGVEQQLAPAVGMNRIGTALGQQVVAVGQRGAGGLALAAQIGEQGASRRGCQVVVGRQLAGEIRIVQLAVGGFKQAADPLRQRPGAALFLGAPKRDQGVAAAAGDRLHLVGGDAGDAPDLVAQREGVTERPLPDELLVELAHGRLRVGGAQGEVAAVGDHPARQEQQPPHVGPGAGAPVGVQRQPRLQLPEPRAGPAAGEHGHDALEVPPLQVVVRGTTTDFGEELIQRAGVVHGHGQDHLGEHVQPAGAGDDGLDSALGHRPGRGRRVDKRRRVQRQEPAA